MPPPARVIVLDNEAVQGLLDTGHRKHRVVLEHLHAARGPRTGERAAILVPMVVRVEAGWIRTDPSGVHANRLADASDVPLAPALADAAARLQRQYRYGVVDSVVAAVAAAQPQPTVVLTSDVDHLRELVGGSQHVTVVAL